MKNITFSAQEEAIDRARKIAQRENTTLNELFRAWLENINLQANQEETSSKINSLWAKTNYLRVGKKLSRDEMNER